MNADAGRTGVVVAGGPSARFGGRDKATARLDGTPLIRHVVDELVPAVDEVVVNCRAAQRDPFEAALAGVDVRFAEDTVHDRGPLAGVRAGLRAARGEYVALVACDMPYVPAGLLDFLLRRARDRTGAVPRVDGRRQPFPAVVHGRAGLDACRSAFRRRPRSLEGFLDALDPEVVPERAIEAYAGPDAFVNVNTPAELRAAAERR